MILDDMIAFYRLDNDLICHHYFIILFHNFSFAFGMIQYNLPQCCSLEHSIIFTFNTY